MIQKGTSKDTLYDALMLKFTRLKNSQADDLLSAQGIVQGCCKPPAQKKKKGEGKGKTGRNQKSQASQEVDQEEVEDDEEEEDEIEQEGDEENGQGWAQPVGGKGKKAKEELY